MITGEVNIIAVLGAKFIKIATLWTGQSSFSFFLFGRRLARIAAM